MNIKQLIRVFLLLLCVVYTFNASATAKRRKPDLQLLQATSQRVLPGMPGAPIITNYYFAVVWTGAKPPGMFYWKDETEWRNCKVSKAHKFVNKGVVDYSGVPIDIENIRKGDTLIIATAKPGRSELTGMPKVGKSMLCYKTGSSNWLLFPVKSITKKPDVAMP